ncbi:hypothetical protein DD688_07515 [Bifidobacterium animalis]|nr:hypothetical protein DU497_07625 [Bifidobacterium animalis subsp. lactis]KAB5632385.1 hypothetical protein GBA51_07705 [Bifidobacterium animalis]KAB1935130.1 hypothetical protein F8253_06965 [Bifidobacterium animalis subsp. lactis]KAB5633064.1 hypothetical protein GBA56_07695 [Bifidobacterium animalis]KAB5639389.1 hypothetical protein GBA54_07695 [Bifidobacterium animalis]
MRRHHPPPSDLSAAGLPRQECVCVSRPRHSQTATSQIYLCVRTRAHIHAHCYIGGCSIFVFASNVKGE